MTDEELQKAARFAGFQRVESYQQYLVLVAELDTAKAAIKSRDNLIERLTRQMHDYESRLEAAHKQLGVFQ